MSDVLRNPGRVAMAHLADVRLATGVQDLVNTKFLSQELFVFGVIDSRCHSVEWLLYCLDVVFLQ
jgi:hypothetical protein